MKTNVNNIKIRLARKALLLLGVSLLTATAFGIGAYYSSVRQIDSNERDAAVLERLMEARHANMVIQSLNRGHEAEAKQYLKAAFADNVKAAEMLSGDASPKALPEIKIALAQFARDEKAHPEFYAVAKAAGQATPSIQIARQSTRP